MANYWINNTGGDPTAAIWDQVTNVPTIHATTNNSLANNSTITSAVFTAPNTTNKATGAAFYIVTVQNNNSFTLNLALQEYNGTTWTTKTTSGTISMAARIDGTNNYAYWTYLRFSSAYTFTTTTTGYYRLQLTSSNGSQGTVTLASDGAAAGFCYMATDNRTGPATTDNFMIAGPNRAATTVTVGSSTWTLGAGSANELPLTRSVNNALLLIDQGILTASTSVNSKIVCTGNFCIGNNGLYQLGTSGTPFPNTITHTLEMVQGGANNTYCFDPWPDKSGSLLWYGSSPQNTNGGTSYWKTTYSASNSGASIGSVGNPLILTDPVYWASGTEIVIGATSGTSTDTVRRWLVPASGDTTGTLYVCYSSAALTTVSALTGTYNSYAPVINMTRNILVTTDNASYGVAIGGNSANGSSNTAGGRYVLNWWRQSPVGLGGTLAKSNYFPGNMSFTGAVLGPMYTGYTSVNTFFSVNSNSTVTNCVTYGSDSGNYGAGPNASYSSFVTLTGCYAFKCATGFATYSTNIIFQNCVAISCSQGFGVGSYTAVSTWANCEAHCCTVYGFNPEGYSSTYSQLLIGTKGANAADLGFSQTPPATSTLVDCSLGSSVRTTLNTVMFSGINCFLQQVNGNDQNEYYDTNGRWFSSGSYNQITGQCDQTTNAAQFLYLATSNLISGTSLYAQATLQIQNTAYYAGTYTLPQLIIASDLGATTATATATATTSQQSIGAIISPTTNNGYVDLTLSLQTNASQANSQVVFTSLIGNIRSIGYSSLDVAFNPCYKPLQSPAFNFGTPVVDPVWSVTNPTTLAGYASLFTINYSAQTVTVTSSATLQNLYDYAQYSLTLSANRGQSVWLTSTDGVHFTSKYSLILNAPLTGTGYLTFVTGQGYSGSSPSTIVFTTSSGTIGLISISGLSGNQVYLANGSGVQQDWQTSVTGTYLFTVPAGSTGTWTYIIKKYGSVPVSGSFPVSGGGYFTAAYTAVTDPFITQTNPATVAAYTTLENWDKFYDYCQYAITQITYNSLAQFATKSGQAVSIGSYNYVVNSSAGSVFVLSSGTITVNASAIAAGITFTGVSTSGTVSTAGSAIINTWYISSAGTSVLITAPNILSGSFYQIYDVTTSTVLSTGTAGVSGVYYRLNYTSSDTIRLRTAFYSGTTGYLPTQSVNVITATGVSFLDSQSLDTAYNSNTINGSTVTEYTTDYVHIYIDVSSGNSSPQRLYAWYCYQLMTASGMINYFEGITAIDAANYQINHAVANILLYNTTSSTVAFITGAALYRDDGSVPVASTTAGAIVIFNGKSVVVGVSGLTTAQNQSLNFIKTLTSFIAVK